MSIFIKFSPPCFPIQRSYHFGQRGGSGRERGKTTCLDSVFCGSQGPPAIFHCASRAIDSPCTLAPLPQEFIISVSSLAPTPQIFISSSSFTSAFKYPQISPNFKQKKTNFLGILSPCPSGCLLPFLTNALESCLHATTSLPLILQLMVIWLLFPFSPHPNPAKLFSARSQTTSFLLNPEDICKSLPLLSTASGTVNHSFPEPFLPLAPNHFPVSYLFISLLLLFNVFYGIHCLC